MLRPFWNPHSGLVIADSATLAGPAILRHLLRRGPVRLGYVGNRMWPAVRSGETFEVRVPERPPAAGEVVVVELGRSVDLYRVEAAGDETVLLTADADPGAPLSVPGSAVIASSPHRCRRRGSLARGARRLALDLAESSRLARRPAEPGGTSIRNRYDAEAAVYAEAHEAPLAPAVGQAFDRHVPSGRALVLGCGAGTEALSCARRGLDTIGLDMVPAMVEAARTRATRAALAVRFEVADVAAWDPGPERFAVVLFTPELLRMIETRARRVAVLSRARAWLEGGGVVVLPVHTRRDPYARLILRLNQVFALFAGRERGDSFRWRVDESGAPRMVYTHVYTPRDLAREIRSAGLAMVEENGSVLVLRPENAARAAPRSAPIS